MNVETLSKTEAWHFINDDGRNSRTNETVRAGQTERVFGQVIPERWGLHASVSAADAVFWAQGLMVCRVLLGGQIVCGSRKLAAGERTVLWMADARAAVWSWLILCAQAAVRREQIAGRAVERIFLDCIAARAVWLENKRAGEKALDAVRGVARQRARKLNGQDARGKKVRSAELTPPAIWTLKMCASLVETHNTPWRTAAARSPEYGEAIRQWEADRLEAKLWKLQPSSTSVTSAVRATSESPTLA